MYKPWILFDQNWHNWSVFKRVLYDQLHKIHKIIIKNRWTEASVCVNIFPNKSLFENLQGVLRGPSSPLNFSPPPPPSPRKSIFRFLLNLGTPLSFIFFPLCIFTSSPLVWWQPLTPTNIKHNWHNTIMMRNAGLIITDKPQN